MFIHPSHPLVLASASQSRAKMFESIGLSLEIVPSHIDEQILKDGCSEQGKSAGDAAMALAIAKARHVSQQFPNAYIIGADSLIHCGDVWYDKAKSLSEAREQLKSLRGKTHTIETAVCVVKDGEVMWSHLSSPRLIMRSFSDEFLDGYINQLGDKLLHCVGCYQVEGPGIQLFETIEGDFFAIMGLPLLPLLSYLREAGLLLE